MDLLQLLGKIWADYQTLSPANKAAFVLGVLGVVAAPAVSITAWVMRRLFRTESEEQRVTIDGLRKAASGQEGTLRVVRQQLAHASSRLRRRGDRWREEEQEL
jgi:membrane protein implicated in regulation of membrane protease activity